jgi:hypothetical protein
VGSLDGASVRLYLVALSDRIECGLDYHGPGEAEPWHTDFTVSISRTRPNYGGERVWLHCTTGGCGRRVARLHLVMLGLVCRSCAGVRYLSQIEDKAARRRARAATIRARLDPPSGQTRLPSKPKGMHQQTFERLLDELYLLENTPQPRNKWPPEHGWYKKRGALEANQRWSFADVLELELTRCRAVGNTRR